MWQPITGGGEDGESTLETAVRETDEECGHRCAPEKFIPLKSQAMIPANEFPGGNWGPEVTEIPEHAFGVELYSMEIKLSDEHTAYLWLPLEKARARVYWPSNAQAMLELHERLSKA
jgi:dATP pyrophosphohydrolase